jgi:predicted nucleic acid-binding protein
MDKRLVLIDTSAWIKALRQKGHSPQLASLVSRLLEEDRVVTLPLVILELLAGIKSDKDYHELLEEFNALHQLDLTDKLWQEAYRVSFRLKKGGLIVPIADLILSVLAIHYDCELLHADRHFDLLAKYLPLRITKGV